MAVKLHLVRHGPTHAKTMTGWTDLPSDLSDTAALARLAAHLPDAPVLSSDLCRAVATADAIAGPRPRLPPDPALREIHFGDWEGRTFTQAEADTPALIRAFWETPGAASAPGGESWDDLTRRVWSWADAQTPGETLIVVAHFGPILALLQRALNVTAVQVFAHKIDNLSVTEVSNTPAGWTTGRINHRP